MQQKLPDYNLYLEVHNDKCNIHRFYRIYTMQNLFSEQEIITIYGRVGTRGKIKYYRSKTEQAFQQTINQLLKKRLNSKKRIGVNYCLK